MKKKMMILAFAFSIVTATAVTAQTEIKKVLLTACFGLLMTTFCFSQSQADMGSDVKGFFSEVQISLQAGNRQPKSATYYGDYYGLRGIANPEYYPTYNNTNNIKMQYLPAITVMEGYRFNTHWATGLGIGYEIFDYDLFPTFANVRYTFWDNKLSPYFSFKAGYAFSFSKTKHYDGIVPISYLSQNIYRGDLKNSGGLLLHPEMGIKLPLNEKFDLLLSIAYRYQKIESTVNRTYGNSSEYFDRWIYKDNLNRLSFGLAIMFR